MLTGLAAYDALCCAPVPSLSTPDSKISKGNPVWIVAIPDHDHPSKALPAKPVLK
jgi:hypothetical protein